jgi:capsular exopolysaccharide synthesis family protein
VTRLTLKRRPDADTWSPARTARLTAAREAFRVLRSNLLVALPGLDNPIVLVTSSLAGEGKTSTCVSLAQSFAEAGSRVVLVDLDLRSPDSHRLLGTHNQFGVSDVLLDHRPLAECVQHVEIGVARSPMRFLATGPQVSSPTELLSTPRTGKVLETLAADADIVLLDAPPVLPVADTLVIGRLAAGAVLVVEAERTPVPAIKRAKDALTRNQARLLGVVLNRFKPMVPPEEYGASGGYGVAYGFTSGPHAGWPEPSHHRRRS